MLNKGIVFINSTNDTIKQLTASKHKILKKFIIKQDINTTKLETTSKNKCIIKALKLSF